MDGSALKKELRAIRERNRRVEADKSWETSRTRKIIIFVLTYLAISIYFFVVGLPEPFLNSVVPALAFVISTMSLPYFKEIWKKSVYRR